LGNSAKAIEQMFASISTDDIKLDALELPIVFKYDKPDIKIEPLIIDVNFDDVNEKLKSNTFELPEIKINTSDVSLDIQNQLKDKEFEIKVKPLLETNFVYPIEKKENINNIDLSETNSLLLELINKIDKTENKEYIKESSEKIIDKTNTINTEKNTEKNGSDEMIDLLKDIKQLLREQKIKKNDAKLV
jgi:hypothetical protein